MQTTWTPEPLPELTERELILAELTALVPLDIWSNDPDRSTRAGR